MEAGADLVLCYPVAALEPFSSILGTVLTAAPSPAHGALSLTGAVAALARRDRLYFQGQHGG